MNTKVLTTLEYDKIIRSLTARCVSPLGKKEAERLVPFTVRRDAEEAQNETGDALSRLEQYGSVSCSGAYDIRDAFLRLNVQANLGAAELLKISSLLQASARVKHYGFPEKEDREKDSLDTYFEGLQPVQALQREIDRCIISEEEIADDASSALRDIRRKQKTTVDRVHSELNRLVNSGGAYLRENIVTMRNGRYCVPVKNEYRSMVPGMIHDESGSGSTVFIEPMSVVRLNNELRELEIAEAKEIEVILAKLSGEAAAHTGELEADLKILSHLDFVFGKAALAREMNASRPVFNDTKTIRIKKGRHPLLDKKTVVPIDLELGQDFTELVVTGPNTGGKTVSLKTVGLFQLMGQAGLHIPAFEGSSLGIFTEIYADIGDEQSIEQSLSTFSSHMKNIVRIMAKADGDSLVLLDELCSGTDPVEGAALATAILDSLRKMEVRVMATTHYSELKLYALSTERVENASCEFDVNTLSPTYRLLIGIPGRSNAFAISKKLGLPMFLIEDAKARMDDDSEHFEDVIRDLNESRKKLEREKSHIGRLKAEQKRLTESLESQESKLDEQKEKILAKAKEEARTILQDAKTQVDSAIRALQKSGGDVRALEKVRTETREMIDKTAVPVKDAAVPKASGKKAEKLHLGDSVLVLSMNMKGTVSSLPDQKGNLFVQMGILRSQVRLSDVTLLEEETVSYEGKKTGASPKGNTPSSLGKAAYISAEINLIGKTVDEALPELDKYLDDAYLGHLPSVRIVHGKGSGILRSAVQAKLRKTSYVKDFRLGEYGEGDAGVTIANFK